ncbi:MAG: hypothetical protein JXA18_09520 [Chitinispirillaceae bacterium]|nr:hypothetical protein [Chitinispirillaceae bacterium]
MTFASREKNINSVFADYLAEIERHEKTFLSIPKTAPQSAPSDGNGAKA